MSDEALARYRTVLATIGVEEATLALDKGGTLASPTLPELVSKARLPSIFTEDTVGHDADVRLGELLGEGGMGRVLAAEQVALGREVAVKVPRGGAVDVAASAQLLREAWVTGRLEHPNIVPIYLLGTAKDGSPLFVMKRIEGAPWSALIHDTALARRYFRRSDDLFDAHLDVLERVCQAVAYAHDRGVLHRDLKPENVMIGAFGEVYVVDWGIAVSLREDSRLPLAREAAGISGTPAFMAPEMAAGAADRLSPRSDVYLLGGILHELVTLRAPHEAATPVQSLALAYESAPQAYGPEVSAELAGVLRRAMAREPADRFDGASSLAAAISAFRRHKSSRELAEAASRRQETLRALLEREAGGAAIEPALVHEAFSESRFGFRQALITWAENPAAKAGVSAVTVEMIGYELRHDHPRAARVLLAELSSPDPAVVRAVEESEARAQLREARFQELERFREQADTEAGADDRSLALLGMAIFWFIASLGTSVVARRTGAEIGYREALLAICVHVLLVLGTHRWLQRKAQNDAQRRIGFTAIAGGVGLVAHWVFGWWCGLSFGAALALFLLWLGMGWTVVGALWDRRALSVSAAYFVAALATKLAPAWPLEIFGTATLLGFGALALSWRGQRREAAAP